MSNLGMSDLENEQLLALINWLDEDLGGVAKIHLIICPNCLTTAVGHSP